MPPWQRKQAFKEHRRTSAPSGSCRPPEPASFPKPLPKKMPRRPATARPRPSSSVPTPDDGILYVDTPGPIIEEISPELEWYPMGHHFLCDRSEAEEEGVAATGEEDFAAVGEEDIAAAGGEDRAAVGEGDIAAVGEEDIAAVGGTSSSWWNPGRMFHVAQPINPCAQSG